jgi:uncharacterized membrane protein
LRPAPIVPPNPASAAPIRFAQIQPILEQRCWSCHGAQLQMKNIRLDSTDLVKQHALTVYQQVAVTRQMPMNNATGITEDERQLIKQWYEQGARFD